MAQNVERPPSARPDWVRRSGAGVAVWTPADWEEIEAQGFALALLGPPEDYRVNLSIATQPLEEPTALDLIVQAAAEAQGAALTDFLEYDRHTQTISGVPAVHREYAWFEGQFGLVLYQHELAAIVGGSAPSGATGTGSDGGAPSPSADGEAGTLVQIHLTSSAPLYFRFAATFRRITESLSFSSDLNPSIVSAGA